MKKTLSFLVILAMFLVPMAATLAEGETINFWADNQYNMTELGLLFAVPTGATVMPDEEVAAMNQKPATTETNPLAMAVMTLADKNITFIISYQDLSANAALAEKYVEQFGVDQATAMGVDVKEIVTVEQDYLGYETMCVSGTLQGLTMTSNLIFTETGVYVFTIMAPVAEVETLNIFLTEAFAPMMAE